MKKLIYLLGLLLPAATYAQNAFYLSASGGAGISNTNRRYVNPGGSAPNQGNIFNYNAKLGVGYQSGHWRFQTGLQYLTSGYLLKDLVFSADFNPDLPYATGTGSFQITYQHIGVPVQVSYTLPAARKLNLVPTLGLLTTYNTGAQVVIKEGGIRRPGSMLKEDFKKQYNSISFWGNAAFYLEYQVSNRIALFGGPSMHYMISNMEQKPDNSFNFTSAQRSYSFNFDIGMNFTL